jgi:hypothetical protein
MARTFILMFAAATFLIAACNAANQGTTGMGGRIPGQPEPGSPAAQMQQ